MTRLGIVRHPTRDVGATARLVEEAAAKHGIEVVDVDTRQPLPEGLTALVSLGGDGTMLAALHAGEPYGVPVMGVACGSLGALTTVKPAEAGEAIARLAAGGLTVLERPAIEVTGGNGTQHRAFNDVVVVRSDGVQASLAVSVGGDLYARVAGDGIVVSTPAGSTAYGMAAGGPLLWPALRALVVTPIAPHAGSVPPLVLPAGELVSVAWLHQREQTRVEIDGHERDVPGKTIELRVADSPVRVLALGPPPPFEGLRERGIVADCPRAVVVAQREARAAAH